MKARIPQRILLVLLAFACMALPARAGEAEWVCVRTENFTVVGRGRERDVRREAARLEQFHAVLSTVFARLVGGESTGLNAPTTVILFPDDAGYAPFKPVFDGRVAGGVVGHFQSGSEVNYIALSLAGEREEESSSTLYHEYVHLLINSYFRATPTWLKEGLAEFYSTARVSGGRVTLGAPIKPRQQLLRRGGLTIPLETLIAVDEASPLYLEDARRSALYSESWALVHYLLNGGNDARREQLTRYLDLLASGADAASSFRETFGTDTQELERELAVYISRSFFPERVEAFERGAAFEATPRAAPLSNAELEAHLGDMLMRAGREDDAEARLRRALEADARLAPAHVSLGALRLRQGRLDEAVLLLRRGIALDPRNHLARYYLADALRREGVSGVISAADFDEKTRLIRAELKRAIELAPGFVEAYKLLALVELERGDEVNEAAALLERAITLAPRRREFTLLLAQARIRNREFTTARELITAAMRRAGDPKFLKHAEKLLAVIAAREEEEGRKAADEAARASSAATGETTQPCDMPEAGPYHKRLRFKGQQACGRLVQIECEGDGVVLLVEAGDRTLRLRGDALSRIRFVTYTTEVKTGQLDCGARTPANSVLVTFRPRRDSASGFDGEIISVEFVPADWSR